MTFTGPPEPPASISGGPGSRETKDDDAAVRGALRIFIAEDEFLVATLLEEDLRSFGYTVVGPFGTLAQARQAAQRERFDVAILDINMNGEMAYPLADDLLAHAIPFIFLSGYGPANLPERFRALPRVAKPYDPANLVREIRRIAAKAG